AAVGSAVSSGSAVSVGPAVSVGSAVSRGLTPVWSIPDGVRRNPSAANTAPPTRNRATTATARPRTTFTSLRIEADLPWRRSPRPAATPLRQAGRERFHAGRRQGLSVREGTEVGSGYVVCKVLTGTIGGPSQPRVLPSARASHRRGPGCFAASRGAGAGRPSIAAPRSRRPVDARVRARPPDPADDVHRDRGLRPDLRGDDHA